MCSHFSACNFALMTLLLYKTQRVSQARSCAWCWGKVSGRENSSTCLHLRYNQDLSLSTLSPPLPPPWPMYLIKRPPRLTAVRGYPITYWGPNSVAFFVRLGKSKPRHVFCSRMGGNRNLDLVLNCPHCLFPNQQTHSATYVLHYLHYLHYLEYISLPDTSMWTYHTLAHFCGSWRCTRTQSSVVKAACAEWETQWAEKLQSLEDG